MSAELFVGGRRFRATISGTVRRSLEEASSSFALQTAPLFPGGNPVRLALGELLRLELDGETAFTGYLDELEDAGDAGATTVSLSGRSKTCDLVDCSAPLGALNNVTVLDVATLFGTRYGVRAVANADVGARFGRVVPSPGETNHAVIERLAQERGLLVTDDADGNLVLTRAGADATSVPTLARPGNLLGASWRYSIAERFSVYECRSQRAADPNTWGRALNVSGLVEDDAVLRFRNRTITDVRGGPAAVRERLTWEASTQAGRSVSGTAQVKGHRSPAGPLWTPGQKVFVNDETKGVVGVLVIRSVDFAFGAGGDRTSLDLAPVEGFELLVPTVQRTGRRGGSKVGAFTFRGGAPTLEDVR